MNCNAVRGHWNLHRDSEGDAEMHFRIEEHLAICPDCSRWYSQQNRLEYSLIAAVASDIPTDALWDQVFGATGLAGGTRKLFRRRIVLAASIFVLATFVICWIANNTVSPAEQLAAATVDWHQRLASGEETVQFQSESDLEVENYLRQRVSFPVRCPPRKDAGFLVQGAGVFRIADRPAAYLFGKVDEEPVSIFVLARDNVNPPAGEAVASGPEASHLRQLGDYEITIAGIDKNIVVAVGRTSFARLDQVLRAYGTYPE
jgi:anti-sigma factor RsiW